MRTPGGETVNYADDEPLTVPEVMAWLRLGRDRVYELIRSKELRSFTMGSSRRISAKAVREYLAALEEAA